MGTGNGVTSEVFGGTDLITPLTLASNPSVGSPCSWNKEKILHHNQLGPTFPLHLSTPTHRPSLSSSFTSSGKPRHPLLSDTQGLSEQLPSPGNKVSIGILWVINDHCPLCQLKSTL